MLRRRIILDAKIYRYILDGGEKLKRTFRARENRMKKRRVS